MSKFNAYHFTGSTLRDGRPVPAIGETLIHDGPIVWCESGLYASRTAWEALHYAPGPMLHRVWCEDVEMEEGDKLVCRRRTIVASIDATHLLRRFAADQALSVAHLWDMPDVVREYLTTLDETKRPAATWAAWAAAWAASAREAAWAARETARAASAWEAARAASAWGLARLARPNEAAADFNARVDVAFAA